MAKFKGQTETMVGIFVIGSLVLLLMVVLFLGKRQNIFEKRYELRGAFKSVAGLEQGADVLLSGIRVGQVEEIKFGSDNRVTVLMSIAEAQKEWIRRDSVASIRTRGLVGDRYVEITTGSPAAPPIPDHGTVRTTEPIDLAALLEETRPMMVNLEGLITNLSAFSGRLTESSGSLSKIFENIDAITTDIRRGKGTVGALLEEDRLYKDTSEALRTAREALENFREVSKDARRASKNLPNLMAETRASLRKLGEGAEVFSHTMMDISKLVTNVDDVVQDTKTIASNLKSSSEQIKKVTPKIEPLLESVDEGIREGRRVIEAAEKNWLIRGHLEPAPLAKPLSFSGRDRSPEDEDRSWGN